MKKLLRKSIPSQKKCCVSLSSFALFYECSSTYLMSLNKKLGGVRCECLSLLIRNQKKVLHAKNYLVQFITVYQVYKLSKCLKHS